MFFVRILKQHVTNSPSMHTLTATYEYSRRHLATADVGGNWYTVAKNTYARHSSSFCKLYPLCLIIKCCHTKFSSIQWYFRRGMIMQYWELTLNRIMQMDVERKKTKTNAYKTSD